MNIPAAFTWWISELSTAYPATICTLEHAHLHAVYLQMTRGQGMGTMKGQQTNFPKGQQTSTMKSQLSDMMKGVEGQMRWSLKRSRTTSPALPLSLLLTTSGSGGVARQIGASAVCGGCGENRSEIVPIRNRTLTSADTHGRMTHMTCQSLRLHPGYGLASHSVSTLQPLLYLLYIRARTRRSNRISLFYSQIPHKLSRTRPSW